MAEDLQQTQQTRSGKVLVGSQDPSRARAHATAGSRLQESPRRQKSDRSRTGDNSKLAEDKEQW